MPSDQNIRIAIVIPAYKPSAGLVDLVRALAAAPKIVVVDDGSGPDFRGVFEAVSAFPNVELLRHAVNLGKGAALKTAFNHVLCTFPEAAGVVTADADGQHHPEDIAKVAESLLAHPDSLVLGARTFGDDVPLRSRFGNIATRGIMHALLGQKLQDTQTGLRGIPASLLPELLRMEASGYEFELEMLIAAHHLDIPVVEVPIRTIYEHGNKSSHFNPVIDSMKIYFVLLRFGSVSLMSALLDNIIWYITWKRTGNVLTAQVLARTFAVVFNYWMVRSSVFYSRQRHAAVLPKYLALVVVSGSVSYGGIRLLSASLGINPLYAKLAVETILFFVNFAVQRLFIFKPSAEGSEVDWTEAPRVIFAIVTALVFVVLVGIEFHALQTGHLFQQDLWFPAGVKRFLRYIGMYTALAVPLLLMFPWSFAGFMTALVIVLSAISVGPMPVLATAFFLISCCALGSVFIGRTGRPSGRTDLVATLLGASLYIFFMTIVARLPVNYPWVWAAILAGPILADWRGVHERARHWAGALRCAELRSGWERATLAVLVFILIAHWFVALKPETSTDGLAMHLAIPMDFAAHHRLTFEPARVLWSVMPMGADWGYSIVYLLGGEFASKILDWVMLLLTCALIVTGARRWVNRGTAYLLAASFAATPLVQFVTGSLFVENFVAAMILGILTAVWEFGETGKKRYLFVSMAIAGAALTTKLGSFAFLAFLLPYVIAEIVRHWRKLGRHSWATCALAAGVLIATAAPTYAIAYAKTHNPIYPFNNTKIHSPLLDPTVDVNDARFRIPLDFSTLYALTFRSNTTYEGQDGSFGFQYFVIAPLALLGLLVATRQRVAQSCAIAAWGSGLLIMRSQPNARYLYAAMPLITVGFAALLGWFAAHQRWMYRVLAAYLFAAIALDVWFLPSASYYHKEFCLRLPFSRAERVRYLNEGAPVRVVIAYYNRNHAGTPVLHASGNEFAGLDAPVYVNHWHQYPAQAQLRQALSVEDEFHLLQSWKVGYIIAQKESPDEPLRPPNLRKLLALCATPEYEAGDIYLSKLDSACDERTAAAKAPDREPMVVPAGFYDDMDPAVRYRGDWDHDASFAEPNRHTVSYTDIPRAEAAFAFEGSKLTYIYTKAPNRGIATVIIDGAEHGRIDAYSPAVLWQSREVFQLAPGRHSVTIRVSGDFNPKSSGKFVDLDSFIVE